MKLYKQAPNLQIIPLDEEETVILSETDGNIHYVDMVANTIFSLFKEPIAKETVLQRLCQLFSGDTEIICKEGGDMIDTFYEKGLLVEVPGSDDDH